MTSSTSNSELLPSRAKQWQQFGRLLLRIVLPLLLIGLLICLGLDWVVRVKLIGQTPSHGAAKLYRIQEPHPGEIAIIGSSRALCSYIPDSLGPNYYNYGVNGAGFAVMDIFLKRALEHPDTTPIILNLDYEMFYYQMGDINTFLPHTDMPEVRPLLKRAGNYSMHMELPGIRYYGCVDAFMKDRLNERLQLTKITNKGAVIDKSPFNAAQFEGLVRQREDSVLRLAPFKLLVDQLMERIHSHRERTFVLVVAPYHNSYLKSLDITSIALAQRLLDDLRREPNTLVLDWAWQNWSDDYFTNTTHVNVKGANAISAKLREAMATVRGVAALPPKAKQNPNAAQPTQAPEAPKAPAYIIPLDQPKQALKSVTIPKETPAKTIGPEHQIKQLPSPTRQPKPSAYHPPVPEQSSPYHNPVPVPSTPSVP